MNELSTKYRAAYGPVRRGRRDFDGGIPQLVDEDVRNDALFDDEGQARSTSP